MAWNDLKAAVAAVIRTNGTQAITGALLQSTLNSIIDQVGANSTFKGVATPSTNPGTPDGPVFYLASSEGVYANFGFTAEEPGIYTFAYVGGVWDCKPILTGVSNAQPAKLLALQKEGYEYLNGSQITKSGYIIASNGTLGVNSEYTYSGYYLVYPGLVLSLENFTGSATVAKVDYYDRNKTRINSPVVSSTNALIIATVPADAMYARFCYQSNIGGTPTALASVKAFNSLDGRIINLEYGDPFKPLIFNTQVLTYLNAFRKAVRGIYLYGNIESNATYSVTVIGNTPTLKMFRIFKRIGTTNTEVCSLNTPQSGYTTGTEVLTVQPYGGSGVYADVLINWDLLRDVEAYGLYPDSYKLSEVAFNKAAFNYSLGTSDLITALINKEDFDHNLMAKSLANQIAPGNAEVIYGDDWVNSGHVVDPTGGINPNSEYVYSDFYECLPYQVLKLFDMTGTTSVLKVSFYNISKVFIPSGKISTSNTSIRSVVPEGAKYVRYCYQSNIGGTPTPIPAVHIEKTWENNAIQGLYVPLNQINYGHALTNQRDFPWLFTGYRTKASEKNILANIIKVPIQTGIPDSAFEEYRLLIASSESVTTPSLMRDVTDQIDSVNFAVTDDTFTVIKMKTPLYVQFGEVIVFMWKKATGFTVRGNINPDTSTENKLQFIYSGTGQTDWNQAMTVSSGTNNRTPAMVCLIDEKYEEEQTLDTWSPRRTKMIATMEDFQSLSGATQEEDGWSLLGTGSFVRNLHYNVDTYMEKIKMSASFRIKALDSGVLSFSFGKYLNAGTYGEIRITEGFFQLWYEYSGGGSTKYYEQALTGFTMAVGAELVLTISKIAESVTYSVTDGTNTISKTVLRTEKDLMCLMHARPYVGITSGQVLLKNISVSSDYDPVYSKIGMWGDSFFEGSTMVSYGLQNRYGAKLAEAVGPLYCPIFGRGGRALDASLWNEFQIENEWFRPKYGFIGLGTNNLDFNSYAGYVLTIVDYLKQRNQIPVLVTVTPRPGNSAFLAQANPFIKSLGERYVDMNKAVTIPGDPNTWVSGYVQGDLVHPSVAGHNAMFERIKIDLPELFNL